MILEFLQVMAGGESWTIGCEHNGAHFRFVRNLCERLTECDQERLGQTVAHFGPVERQNGDAAHVFAQEDQRRSGCNAHSGRLSIR